MSKAKSTTSSKSSSRLVRNRTVELVSRKNRTPDFSGKKWSKWRYQCCLDEHQESGHVFYGAKMAKIRIRACIYLHVYIYIDIYKFVQVPSSIILAWKDFFVFSLKVGDHVNFDYYYHTITMVIKTQGMNCCSWCKVTSASFLSN